MEPCQHKEWETMWAFGSPLDELWAFETVGVLDVSTELWLDDAYLVFSKAQPWALEKDEGWANKSASDWVELKGEHLVTRLAAESVGKALE